MKSNTTTQRIYCLFQRPSKRFTDTVSAIADSRIAINRNANRTASYGGELEAPDTKVLVEENLGKIFTVTAEFSVDPGAETRLFVEEFETPVDFPAGTDIMVVPYQDGDDTLILFDVLGSTLNNGNGYIEVYNSNIDTPDTINIGPASGINLREDLISFRVRCTFSGPGNEKFEAEATNAFYISDIGEKTMKVVPFENFDWAGAVTGAETYDGIAELKVFVKC